MTKIKYDFLRRIYVRAEYPDIDVSYGNYLLNGKLDDLIRDGSEVGVTHYLVHSVATTPKQVKSINEFISEAETVSVFSI